MYRHMTDFTEIECWNSLGAKVQYWLRQDELKQLIARIELLAEQRAKTNKISDLQCTELKLNYPIR